MEFEKRKLIAFNDKTRKRSLNEKSILYGNRWLIVIEMLEESKKEEEKKHMIRKLKNEMRKYN